MMLQKSNSNSFSVSTFFFTVLFLSSLNFELRTLDEINTQLVSSGVVHRVIGFFLLFFYVLYKSPKILKLWGSSGLVRLITLYCIYRLITAVWSVFPIWTVYRVAEYIVVLCVFLLSLRTVADMTSVFKILNKVNVFYTFLLGTTLLGVIFAPNEALSLSNNLIPKISGVWPRWNSNGIGQATAILALLALIRFQFTKDTKFIYIAAFAFLMLILSQTRSAFIPFLVLACFILTMRLDTGRAVIGWIFIVFIVALLALTVDFFSLMQDYVVRGQSQEELLSLSNRITMWEASISNIQGDWWTLLFGLGAFAGGRHIAEQNYIATSGGASNLTLDNFWLEILVDEGFFGLLFVAIILIRVFEILRGTRLLELRWVGYTLFGMLLFRSLFVSNLLLHTNFYFYTLLVLAIVGEQYCKSNRAKRHRPIDEPAEIQNGF